MEASERASIVAQTAAKVAGQVTMGSNDLTAYLEAVEEIHKDLLKRQYNGLDTIEEQQQKTYQANVASVQAAQQAVAQGLPGAQVVYQGPTAPPAGVFPPGTVTVAAEPITDEAAWADVFTHPNNWFNNTNDPERSTLHGGKGPDFRAKNEGPKDGKGRAKALWLYSQYGNAPQWVFEKLGIVPQQQQVSQTSGAPVPNPF